jgi:hypothetical protein
MTEQADDEKSASLSLMKLWKVWLGCGQRGFLILDAGVHRLLGLRQ